MKTLVFSLMKPFMPPFQLRDKLKQKRTTMSRPSKLLTCVLIVLVLFSFFGCASGPRGKLKRVENPTEDGLRQNWNEYTVYYRRSVALIFKTKDDSKIELGSSWIEVTSDSMMKKTGIMDFAWVQEILGQNDKMFGYLMHRSLDSVYVGIVDENTVKLSYYVKATSGGR